MEPTESGCPVSDYDYCEKHDTSFLMPELLMCPKCAVERLRAGAVDEPIGDALIEAFDTIEKQARASDAQAEKLAGLLREALRDLHYLNNIDGEDRDLPDRITEALAAYDAERKSIPQVDQAVDKS